MSWGIIATVVVGAGSAYYEGEVAKDIAEAGQGEGYVQSDLSKKTQQQLSEQGTALTTGEGLPSWLQPLTSYGSQELEDVISRASSDITKQSTEAAAIQGTRTGRNIPQLNKSIADFSANLRYSDLQNTNSNIMSLYGTGLNTLSGVRDAEMGMDSAKTGANQYLQSMATSDSRYANQQTADMYSSAGGAIGSIIGAWDKKDNETPASAATSGYEQYTSFEPITLRGSASGSNIFA